MTGQRLSIRDTSLYVDVIGNGYPLLLMHGGPGADHWTLKSFRRCADRLTLVFYDHRCNGRSWGAPVTSFTWDNLTADADALRERLGFSQWAVLGHSFGGNVALEYALRYPEHLSHLILLDTGGDSDAAREYAAEGVAARGYGPRTVNLVRRFFDGQIRPSQMIPAMMRFGGAYYHDPSLRRVVREMLDGGWRTKVRADTFVYAGRVLLNGWSVMDRLDQIETPTLVIAGRDDFIFPPEHQKEIAARIPRARLHIVDRAGHNPHDEQPDEVFRALTEFLVSPGSSSTRDPSS